MTASKRKRLIALVEAHVRSASIALSMQVLLETYHALVRAALLDKEGALAVVEALAEERVVTTDAAFVKRAIRLAQRHRLSHWDGMIVQAAVDAGCTVLFSEDLHAGLRFGDVEVVNPFLDAVHQPQPSHATSTGKRTPLVRKSRRK